VLPFASVARRLEDRWRGVGLLDPAFDDTVEAPASIGAVAERLIEGLLRSDPSGPYLLAGYSYGGFVAFEVARRIVAAGGRAGVVILDTRLPSGGVTKALRRQLNEMRDRLRLLVRPAEEPQMPPDSGLHDGPSLREMTRRHVMGEQQRALVLRHRPSRADVPLVVLRARKSVGEQDVADYRWSRVGRVLGSMDTPGDHLTLFKGRNEAEFVLALDRALSLLLDDLAGG
jgi:thioesterase domain-containing protein